MEPRALDSWPRRAGRAVAILVLAAVASRTWAVSVRDIRTDVKPREGYTRCVVELSGKTDYFQRDFLDRRNYFLVDIYNVRPAVAERFITPSAGPVRQVLVLNRKGSNTNVLTLVFYLTARRPYRVFTVNSPFRIVIDVMHRGDEGRRPLSRAVVPSGPSRQPLVRRPGSGFFAAKKIVIIDPGHGGSDPGARSYIRIRGRYVLEKDINLSVSLRLRRLIDASPNLVALMTRETDKYVSLEDRVRFCERFFGSNPPRVGDLFISIHCNASDSWRSRGARGIEFYYLNPRGASRGSVRYLEQIENRNGGSDSTNWKHPIFRTLARERFLAWLTEGRIVCEHLKAACYQIAYYRRYGNRESVIQSAYFRVLFQANMPAVLVELGFLTNAYDCRRLADPRFQQQVATALYNGIVSYFRARDERFEPKYLALPAGP